MIMEDTVSVSGPENLVQKVQTEMQVMQKMQTEHR